MPLCTGTFPSMLQKGRKERRVENGVKEEKVRNGELAGKEEEEREANTKVKMEEDVE